MRFFTCRTLLIVSSVVMIGCPPLLADSPGEADLMRGYYLLKHEHDTAGAAEAFERVLQERQASPEVRAEAERRLAACREAVAARDLARLMPPESLAFVEIREPGRHLARILEMAGLAGHEYDPAGESDQPATPLGDGAFLPEDFAVSPALIDALGDLDGLALAVTDFRPDAEPPFEGLAVLHLGGSSLLRGVAETVVQLMEPAGSVEGIRTYRGEEHGFVAMTHRLLLVATSRYHLAGALQRLRDPDAKSLASQPDFALFDDERADALAFGYLHGPRLMQSVGRHLDDPEAVAARAFLDLDHMRALATSVHTTDRGLRFTARLELMDGHRNLAYALIRTAPLTGQTLDHIPANVAALGLIGLNAPTEGVAAAEAIDALRKAAHTNHAEGDQEFLTAMDLGRELFVNMEEVAVFLLDQPEAGEGEIAVPAFAIAIASADAGRSEALWKQLLELPGTLMPNEVPPAREIVIAGKTAVTHHLPELPPIVVARAGEHVILVGTQEAVTTAMKVGDGARAVNEVEVFQAHLQRSDGKPSKTLTVHAGRTLRALSRMASAHEAHEMHRLSSLVDALVFRVTTREDRTALTLEAEAVGLPDLSELIRTLARHHGPHSQKTQAFAATRPATGG